VHALFDLRCCALPLIELGPMLIAAHGLANALFIGLAAGHGRIVLAHLGHSAEADGVAHAGSAAVRMLARRVQVAAPRGVQCHALAVPSAACVPDLHSAQSDELDRIEALVLTLAHPLTRALIVMSRDAAR